MAIPLNVHGSVNNKCDRVEHGDGRKYRALRENASFDHLRILSQATRVQRLPTFITARPCNLPEKTPRYYLRDAAALRPWHKKQMRLFETVGYRCIGLVGAAVATGEQGYTLEIVAEPYLD